MLPQTFTSLLHKSDNKGGWTYAVWLEAATFFGTHGLVKISGSIDGHPFKASFMATGDGYQMLPIKAETRKLVGKEAGDTVEITILERL
jgi:hypothetical protein